MLGKIASVVGESAHIGGFIQNLCQTARGVPVGLYLRSNVARLDGVRNGRDGSRVGGDAHRTFSRGVTDDGLDGGVRPVDAGPRTEVHRAGAQHQGEQAVVVGAEAAMAFAVQLRGAGGVPHGHRHRDVGLVNH